MSQPVDPRKYGRIKPQDRITNIRQLMKIWWEEGDPTPEDLKKKYNLNQALNFFDGLITQEKQHIVMTKALMQELDETGRLVPEYKDYKHYKVYSGVQLLEYYFETKPRG